MHLSSLAYTEGLYGQFPRIDKDLIKKYKKDVIALSELTKYNSSTDSKSGIEFAEEELKWWLDVFGEDFYIEINRHGLEEEDYK